MKLFIPICILGMPAAGKSVFGKTLAHNWGVRFRDLDQIIEQYSKLSVAEFWEKYGECEFRGMERFLLLRQLLEEPAVISLGGGTPAFLDNMFFIERFSFSIWLKAADGILLQRILAEPRPVFQQKEDLNVRILNLKSSRYLYYQRASYSIDEGFSEPTTLQNVTTYCLEKGIIA